MFRFKTRISICLDLDLALLLGENKKKAKVVRAAIRNKEFLEAPPMPYEYSGTTYEQFVFRVEDKDLELIKQLTTHYSSQQECLRSLLYAYFTKQ